MVAFGMLKAVGNESLPQFLAACRRTGASRVAIQSITMPDERFDAYRRRVDWMQTYIFPGSCIPSVAAIRAAAGDFTLARADDIGPDYAPTLRAWRDHFVAALPEVRSLG